MQQKDKNIFIASIFVVIFLLVWTLTKYDSAKKEKEQQEQEVIEAKENELSSEKAEKINDTVTKEIIIPTITSQETQAQLSRDDVIVVDTRSLQNFNTAHIKNSFHINAIDLAQQSDKTLIFVTIAGNEDALLNYYRDFSGTNKIYNLLGGFNAWINAGYSTISQTIEHTFENNSKVNFVEPRDLNNIMSKTNGKNDDIVIIDARRPGNYSKGHLANAINIPFEDLENRYSEIPTNKKIYIYGHTNDSSFTSGVLLYELGFIGAKTIKGGLEAWQEYGYPIVQDTQQ